MVQPAFQPVAGAQLEEALRKLFVDNLGYSPNILKDPYDKEPNRPEAWRLIFPVYDSRPIAACFDRDLSTASIQQLRRRYVDRVAPHRDEGSRPRPIMYCFTDGARWVFFSASPARTRDDRFDLSRASWDYASVRRKFFKLALSELSFSSRAGEKLPDIDFLFEEVGLSADSNFSAYAQFIRRELMQAVLEDEQALAAVVYHLLETPEEGGRKSSRLAKNQKELRVSPGELYVEVGARLGDAVAAAVDTLLLRHLMMRFIEVHHPEAMQSLLTSSQILAAGKLHEKSATLAEARAASGQTSFGGSGFDEIELDLAKGIGKRFGIDFSKKSKAGGQQLTLFSAEDPAAIAQVVLDEEKKREARLGGDFYLADLGAAAGAIEAVLLSDGPGTRRSKLLQDFLGRTGTAEHAQWDFRYEDLRPQTLQEYYEDSLGTGVSLSFDRQSQQFNIQVVRNTVRQKELGAYYTDAHLCQYMVDQTVKVLFQEALDRLRAAIQAKDPAEAEAGFRAIFGMRICDPTMGSAPFLRAAFQYLSSQYVTLCATLRDAQSALPAFWDVLVEEAPFLSVHTAQDEGGAGSWEWHILRRMLYGVDIDLKAVCIACQTFALSALNYLKQAERFPSFFNVNLKLGNALISPVRPVDRAELAAKHKAGLAKLVALRAKITTLPNTESAYETMRDCLNEVASIVEPIAKALIEDRVLPVLGSFTEELRPFIWELEFPEAFFTAEGELRQRPGFDVVIGNPPWDAVKYHDSEFAKSIGVDTSQVEPLKKRDPRVAAAYQHYRRSLEAWKRWVSDGNWYEHQQGGRDRNKWRLATERSWKLTRDRGAMSLVVPGGIIADEGGYALKKWMFSEGEAGTFISYEKENDAFSGTQAFTLMTFLKGEPTEEVEHLEGLTAGKQLLAWPYKPVPVPLPVLEKMSPGVLTIPSIHDGTTLSILEKLYAHPPIDDASAEWFAATVSYDYHMGNDKKLFRHDGQGIPLLEGKSIEQYEVVSEADIRIRVNGRRQKEPNDQYRVACADVAGTLDVRRMLCALVPHGYATGDKLNCFLVHGDDAERLFLVAVLNSFAIEWRVRQLARSNNVKKFMLLQLPVPRPPRNELGLVAALAAQLVTADARFGDLTPALGGLQPVSDEQERWRIKCRIDALVAKLFGLNAAELERVLGAFDRVPARTKQEVLAEFSKL